MNWDDIRVFLAVARTGQMLGAGRRLRLNHATVARRVSALEAALGTKLFHRRTNGCDLTEAGAGLLERAEQMETAALAAHSDTGGGDAALSGTVRVGAPDGFGVAFLAPRLGALRRHHPHLQIQLVPVPRSFSLSKREADIAITTARPTEGRVVARKLVDYHLGLYASVDYKKEMVLPARLEDLRQHSLIGYVDDLIFAPSLDFAREVWKDWRSDLEISSALGQYEAVRGGAGIGILHKFVAQQDPTLVQVLPEISLQRSYWLVVHEDMRAIARLNAVTNFVVEQVAASMALFGRD